MTAVLNVIVNEIKKARLYFELDPTGVIFSYSILTSETKLFHGESKSLSEIQKLAKYKLNDIYGASCYNLIPSNQIEREAYEKSCYEFMLS